MAFDITDSRLKLKVIFYFYENDPQTNTAFHLEVRDYQTNPMTS